MPNFAGTRLMNNQKWSSKWDGMIDCGGGIIRQPYLYKGKPHNNYYVETKCANCSADMLADKNNYAKSRRSFCCIQCKSEYTKRVNTGNKILKKRPSGDHHVMIKDWSHPRADRHGYVYEHLLVAENKLGRKILKGEVVHHINCIKEDNDPNNLYVCKNSKEHFMIHGSLNKCVASLIKNGILSFDKKNKKYVVKNDR